MTPPETAPCLAVDFGTSNSAVALWDGARVQRIAIEAGSDTLPTAVFFPADGGEMQIGAVAARALIEGEEGRYMRALKSILGDPLLHESRLLGGKRRTLAEVITAFLTELKTRAEAETGLRFSRVLSGRPVRFHPDDTRNNQAEADLRACYHAAGFAEVTFMAEPEAAARAYAFADRSQTNQTGLIIDIGGGTSDFTAFRTTNGQTEILASHGIRLGGTDFDQKISVAHAMPLLGMGGQLRRNFGDGLLPMPNALFQDLASWAKIPFVYGPQTERNVDDLLAHAVDPAPIRRLKHVIEAHLGHELAFAVEAGKITANAAPKAEIEMGFIENDLSTPITTGSMNAALTAARFDMDLTTAIYQTLMNGALTPQQIDIAILVGGSSLMRLVETAVTAACPTARIEQSEAFTAIVDGLAIASKLTK